MAILGVHKKNMRATGGYFRVNLGLISIYYADRFEPEDPDIEIVLWSSADHGRDITDMIDKISTPLTYGTNVIGGWVLPLVD